MVLPFLTPHADDTSLKELKVPTRLCVTDMEEYGIEIAAAISNLSRDGLQCTFQDNSKLQPLSELDIDITFGESSNELIQVIKKVEAVMISLGHELYKGDIYVKPPSAKFTFVLMMNVESYINKLMISNLIGEDVVKFCRKMIEIMCHPDCELIRQIKFNWDLIEVKDGYCFSIGRRDFIECPIEGKNVGHISPRAYAPYYDCKEEPAPLYFKQSVENSFPNLSTGVNFLNKYYQCLTVNKFPHKCPKLVIAGPRDSGKSTWVSVFLPVMIIPFRYIASITKERTFSTAMINSDTQLVFLDEWSPDHLQSDTAKLLLQGGLMVSAVKYEKARMFINNSAFYITTNNVPNFGEDEDANVKRRLKIFETRSMPNPDSKIEPWYRQNSMHCIAWAAKEITQHRNLVDQDELWYEEVEEERGEAEAIADLANGGGSLFFDVEKVKNLKFKDLFSNDDDIMANEENNREPSEPASVLHESFISEAQVAIENRINELEKSTCEDLPNSDEDNDEDLNTEVYHKKIFEEIQNNFFRSNLNDNHLKLFRQGQEKLKVPERKCDAEYDGWCLVIGEPRPEFDLELFLQRHNLARRHIDRLRDATGLRIMPENDPNRAKEASNTEEGVLGIVGEFFRQATKKNQAFLISFYNDLVLITMQLTISFSKLMLSL